MAAAKSGSRSSARKRPAAKSTARKRTAAKSTTRRRQSSKSPAALKRLEKSLGSAQDALKALRNDVGRDTSAGARSIYKDLEKFVRDARRDSGKLGTALQRDLDKAQKKLAAGAKKAAPGRSSARKTTARSTAKRSTARRST